LIEPNDLLEASFLNHAHNDLLEVVLTAGLPGILIVLFAFFGLLRAMIGIWRKPAGATMQLLGASLLLVLYLASLADYPLRTPSLSALAVLAGVWLYARSDQDTTSRPSRTERTAVSSPIP
jgi:O-antigen ligase